MILIGWALLGVAVGAVGAEVLRARKPELVEKMEDAARRLVGSLCSSESEEKDAVAATEEAESALEATAARPDEGPGAEEQESRKAVAEAEPPVLPDTGAVPGPGEPRRTGEQQSVTARKGRRMRTKKTRPE